jgi:hypothetical protein
MVDARRFFAARMVAAAAAASLGLGGVLLVATSASAAPATFTVINGSSDPLVPGSLPWAIKSANDNLNPADTDVIQFDVTAIGSSTITLTAALEFIAQPLTIQGPGSALLEIVRNGGTIFHSAPAAAMVLTVTGLELSSDDLGVVAANGIYAIEPATLVVDDVNAHDFLTAGIFGQDTDLTVTNSQSRSNRYGVYYISNTPDDDAVYLDDVEAEGNSANGASLALQAGGRADVLGGLYNDNDILGLYIGALVDTIVVVDGPTANGNTTGVEVDTMDASTSDVSRVTAVGNDNTGIYLYGDATAVVTGVDNEVEDNGTGVFFDSNGTAGLTLTSTTARLNGTGIDVEAVGSSVTTIDGATEVTTSTIRGMMVAADDSAAVYVQGANVHGNIGSVGAGVVIHTRQNAYVRLDGSHVDGNTSDNFGGGIWIEGIDGPASTVDIVGSTINGNTAASYGGGLYLETLTGTDTQLNITDSQINGNTATEGNGGGIYVEEVGDETSTEGITILRTTIDGNDTPGPDASGGGIAVAYMEQDEGDGIAVLSIQHSTISRNTTLDGGGAGLWLNNEGATSTVEILSSTISGNRAAGVGGVYFDGDIAGETLTSTLRILHSTLANNQSVIGAPTLYYDEAGFFELAYTIFSSPDGPDLNVDNPSELVADASYSTFQDVPVLYETLLAGPGMQFGVNPLLGPLGPNGGSTQTHLLLAGSPALNAGSPAFAPPPATDQRGEPRVVNIIDIGAVEMQPILPATGGELPLGLAFLAASLLLVGVGVRVLRPTR